MLGLKLCLANYELCQDFLGKQRTLAIKEKKDKLDLIKMKNFWSLKKKVKKF